MMGTRSAQSGYSLLEVMISMIILAIAFLALIATQYGALNGYVSARDALEAAEIGRRTSDLLRVQGTQWTINVDSDADVATPPTYDGVAPYNPAFPTPFDRQDTIQEILDASPSWLELVDIPVDVRFNRRTVGLLDDHTGGKFCVYSRGAPMGSAFQTGGVPVVAALHFQIAVVYPGPRGVLTDCTFAGGQITELELDVVGDDQTKFAGGFNPPPLELRGMRVSYFGTVVVRRAHLTNFASGGP